MCISKQVPFDIPDSWEWIRLGELTYNHGQKKPDTVFSYIDIGSIDNLNQKLNSVENHLEPDNAPSRARKIVEKWDIIYSTVRPYLHNMCIIDKDFMHPPIASTGFAVMACLADYCRFFLFYYLLSPCFDNYANNRENSKGVAYPAINDERLYRALIPVPPMEEQQRIVAKIEQILPYIKEYELSESRIGQLNAAFPEQLKKSILQEAIQGKLVPQDPSDEPASVLLERIWEDKARLIKEGKIKKDKNESVIFRRDNSYYEKSNGVERCIDEELPFEIPDSWCWARLKQLGITQTGNTPSKNHKEYFGDYIPFIGPGNISEHGIISSDKGLTRQGLEFGRLVKAGSILQVCIGGSIGKAAINQVDVTFNQQINSITPIACCKEYLFYVMTAPYFIKIIKERAGGTATPIINRGEWDNILIPLAPLKEQNKIVVTVKSAINFLRF